MEAHSPLGAILFFLIAAVIAVPLFRKFKLGAILGYLVAGILIGPQGFNFIDKPESILHFSEIGVVLLLFVIGLELNPDKLWSMRRHILGLGLGQLLISAAAIGVFILLFVGDMSTGVVIGLALGLSSTAFAIQLMAEKGILGTPIGRRGFSILLLQDLAVIPILFLVQSLATVSTGEAKPWWLGLGALVVLLLIGRFALNPMLTIVSRYGSRESMTASSLLIVVGAAYIMQESGLSMGMGAFIAGIMLANSHFRHQLESDIEPFKGLTLGLFFIAIGMTLDLRLFMQSPLVILGLAVGLMIVKTFIIAGLMRMAQVEWRQGLTIGLMLSQGGEFAFVVMGTATAGSILSLETAGQVNLVVGLSMALTSPLVSLISRLLKSKPQTTTESGRIEYSEEPEVMIMGFGRFGQTTGRILGANKIPFIALDKDAEHIDFVKRFGNQVHFGDASRLDVLEAAGIDHVRVVLIAIDDSNVAKHVIELVKQHYPKIKIIARAHNRADFWELQAAGADKVIREVFKGSLEAATDTLAFMGFTSGEALKSADRFEVHDEFLLQDALEHRDDTEKLIEIGRKGRADLERIFSADRSN
ncbi:potassium transporter [Aliikangiella marina]|uniref:Potassium transporter n=1 Tax=Aliikangiella marina TaxID=1712262 RepID=A0A545T4M2_9GAMM|nr:monovalent cation:proton antiporter-2 (CPA2) family protein [Aliikangiella marina]TQV72132.1 potassium transporter [Aliikangiella marina]